jgi:hypothetical protein
MSWDSLRCCAWGKPFGARAAPQCSPRPRADLGLELDGEQELPIGDDE